MNGLNLIGIDIGDPAMAGATIKTGAGYEINAGGSDIWGQADAFHFAYLAQTGDFDFSARLESLGKADLYTKAGLMARATLEANSQHVYLVAFPDNSPRNKNNGGFEFQYRGVEGGESAAVYPADFKTLPPLFPVEYPETWMRLKRSGNLFDAWCRAVGGDWRLYCSFELRLSPNVFLGLAVTAHTDQGLVQAKFSEVEIK